MTVRVIRILEYVYPDHETAEADMQAWNAPINGVLRHGRRVKISSATLMPRTTTEDDNDDLLKALQQEAEKDV